MKLEKKIAKLIKTVQQFVDDDLRQQKKRYDDVKDALKTLKKRSLEMKKELKQSNDDKVCKNLKEDLEIIKLQRVKGLAVLKEVKKAL